MLYIIQSSRWLQMMYMMLARLVQTLTSRQPRDRVPHASLALQWRRTTAKRRGVEMGDQDDLLFLRFPWLRTRACTTYLLGFDFFRVLYPDFACGVDGGQHLQEELSFHVGVSGAGLTGRPHGLTGCTFPLDFPRPPPWGWSAGLSMVVS